MDGWEVFLQAEQELDSGVAADETGEKDVPSVQKWLRENMRVGGAAVDANVHWSPRLRQLEELMRKKNVGEELEEATVSWLKLRRI